MSLDGNWTLVIESPMGKQEVTIDFREESGTLSGTMVNAANKLTSEIFEGSVDGDAVQFKAKLQHLKMTVTFNLTVTGDELEGKVKSGIFGGFKVTGKRS